MSDCLQHFYSLKEELKCLDVRWPLQMLPIFTIAILLLIAYVFNFYQNVRRYPRGPTPLPFIGNLLTLNLSKAHLEYGKLSKVYGNVFTVWLPRPHVVILGYDQIKEAFHTKGEDFSGRSKTLPDIAFQTLENGGVIFSDGDEWKGQRRAALNILRDFGMGKNLMEQQVASSMSDCLQHFYSLKEELKCLDVRWPLQLYVGNVITNTLYGFRYNYNDYKRLQHFAACFGRQLADKRSSKTLMISQIFPWIRYIPFLNYQRRLEKNIAPIHEILRDDISTAMKCYDPSQEPQCFIHAYKQKMNTNEALNDSQLVNVALDFYLAGMETTSTIMRWAVLYMTKHQLIQARVREEIHSVIGIDRMVTMNDKNSLPYCSAVIHEIQRCADLSPLSVTHRTIKDTNVDGHSIPQDTHVYAVLSDVLTHDPVFKDGEVFNPDRFLLPDGKTINKDLTNRLVAFSIGKRQCAGEALARMELFIGFVSLFQHFKFEACEGGTIDLEPIYSTVLIPKPHMLKITPLRQ